MSRHVNGCVYGLLEPGAVKVARPVLRGEGSREAHPPTRQWDVIARLEQGRGFVLDGDLIAAWLCANDRD